MDIRISNPNIGGMSMKIEGVPPVQGGFDPWWEAMSSGLMQMKIHQYCIDRPDGEDFVKEKPVRPPDNAPEPTRKAWENAMIEWNAGNASAIAVIRANLDHVSNNEIPTTIRIASEMIAKLREVYGDAHTLSGHTAWDAFSRCSFSTSGTYSIQEYITHWSRLYSDLVATDKDFTVPEATRFVMFVNSLDPDWRAHALDTAKVPRKNLTKCFEHLREVARQREMHGAMEAKMGNDVYSKESSIGVYATRTGNPRNWSSPRYTSTPPHFSPSPSLAPFPTRQRFSYSPTPATPDFVTPTRQSSETLLPPPTDHRSRTPSPQTPPAPPSVVTPRRRWIQRDLPPPESRVRDVYNVRSPQKGIVSQAWPGFTRRVFSHPERHAFGSRAWDYDGLKFWPGAISPSGLFVVGPQQCVYCLREGHIANQCTVLPDDRPRARFQAFRDLGITIKTDRQPYFYRTPSTALIASPTNTSTSVLSDTRIPPSQRDQENPGPDGRWDGGGDGRLIVNGDVTYWPSFVQAAYEQRGWDVPHPTTHMDLECHPLYLPEFTRHRRVPEANSHYLTHTTYSTGSPTSFDEALHTITDAQYLAFESVSDNEHPHDDPMPSDSVLSPSHRPSAFVTSPFTCSNQKISKSSLDHLSNIDYLLSLPQFDVALYSQTFQPFSLTSDLLIALRSPSCVVDMNLPVNVATNAQAAMSTPPPSAFHTLPNSHSTSSNSPFTTYDAVIPDGAFRFLSRDIPGMETVPVSTFLDSAASVHMSGSPELFTDMQPLTPPIFVGGAFGSGGFATHVGRVKPLFEDRSPMTAATCSSVARLARTLEERFLA
ncbi:hypothetical protein BT69DRAFT_1316802 [Atractiella rhizophila]|nr:hypothetical protein BT69DRAFT_1316802 [Atractiella rhizophila]